MRPPREYPEKPKTIGPKFIPPETSGGSPDIIRLKPTELAEALINLRDMGGMPFRLEGRPYLIPIYNTWHKRMVIIGGRQIEKSTTMSNMVLVPAAARRGYRSLVVNPTDTHTKTFSYDKLSGTIKASPALRAVLGKPVVDNVLRKEWENGSSVLLRSAYLTARSARGIPADQLLIDEAQDSIPDHLPVLAETLTHSHDSEFGRRIVIAGTALIPECMIGEYWENYSTQGEWVVRCPAGHPNILEIENLSEKGIICTHQEGSGRCHRICDPKNGKWEHMFPERKDKNLYVGYRIPQVINPMVHSHWEDIAAKLNTYSNAAIHQEILGRSYEVGTQPISKGDLVRAEDDAPMSSSWELLQDQSVMGIDWGYGDVSYTIVTIGGWDQHNKFRIIYCKKFRLGEEIEPEYQLRFILSLIPKFKVQFIGVDWGAGWGQNSRLKAKFPNTFEFIYSHQQKTLLKWTPSIGRYTANRTETMSHLFEAIKLGNVRFYKGYVNEFGQDYLNVRGTTDSLGRLLYTHKTVTPDDAVHSANYAFLIARILRRDIQPLQDSD